MLRQNSQKYNIFKPFLVSSSQWLSPGMFGHLFPPASFSRYVWASLPPCILFVHSPSSSATRLMQVLTQATWLIPFVQRGNYSLSIVVVGNKVPLSNAGHLQLWWVFFLLEHWCHSNPPTSSSCSIIHDPTISYSSSPPSEHWMKSNRVVHSLGFWSPSHSSSQSSSDNHILPTSGFKSSFLVC